MSDNPTQETPDTRSFEERVFARFDALDRRMDRPEQRMDGLDARLSSLEEKVDARLRETLHIWEAVQARLDGIEGEVKELNRGGRVLHKDIPQVRMDQEELRERIGKLESGPAR